MPTSKTTTEILYGKCRWAKLFSPSQYGKWSLELNLDQDSLTKVLELKRQGIRNVIKKDEEGYWITISRSATIKIMNKETPGTPPVVLTNDGQPWDKNKGIGHGSDVACKIAVREYKVPNVVGDQKGIAIRLEAVKVINLVPFDLSKDFDHIEQEKVKGLVEAEAKPW